MMKLRVAPLICALLMIAVFSPVLMANDIVVKKEEGNGSLTISGTTLVEEKLRLSNVDLVLKENGQVVKESRSDANGKFELKMELDRQYLLYFQKDDYVDKIIEIDTRNVPTDERKYPLYYKNWRVDLIPTDLDVDVSVLKKPVALVIYNPTEYGFSLDKKYERSMRPALKALAEAVFEAYEDRAINQEDALDDYMLALKDGKMFLEEGDYENALFQFEAAKRLQPHETYPDKQIEKTMALMDANKSIDEQYTAALDKADLAFEEKNWSDARRYYEKAHDVKPDMAYPKDQIDIILMNIAAEKEMLTKAEEEARQRRYQAAVKSADSLFALKDYAPAKDKYKEAQTHDRSKAYPATKITEIDNLMGELAGVEKAFMGLMAKANSHLQKENYQEAKEAYVQALGIKPDADEPKAKIKEIDGIMAGLAALQAKQKEMEAARLAKIQEDYEALIASADALLVDKSYVEAKAEYQKALSLKEEEEYPKTKIKEINAALLAIEGVDKQYTKLMSTAGRYYANGELQNARADYVSASELKPSEQAPKDKIAEIDSKLEAQAAALAAKQKAVDDKYNGYIAKADEQLAAKDYSAATESYKAASRVKPAESYPKTKLAEINDILGALAAEKAANEKAAKELAEKQAKYDAIILRADRLYAENKFTEAKTEYQSALTVMEGKTYPVSQIALCDAGIAKLAADAEAQAKLEAERQAKLNEYNAAVAKADAALEGKNFSEARLKYQEAQRILPENDYPSTQLAKIDKLEADEQRRIENQQAFNQYVKEGDDFVAKKEWEQAKYKYEAALKLIPGDPDVIKKMRQVTAEIEAARKLAEFRAKNDTEFNRQLARDYPNGLNETTKQGGKTITRIVIVDGDRGDEYRKEKTSYATFYFKNNKQIDESTYLRETKGH